MSKYSEREEKLQKIALDILQKCEDEKLSVSDYRYMIKILDGLVESQSVISLDRTYSLLNKM